jgi:putative membrane protein
MHWSDGMGGWMMILWAVFGIALVSVIVWGLMRAGSAGAQSRETAEDILRARYARGEISKEQFDQIREDLRR